MAYQGGEESCRPNKTIIAHWYSLSMIILSTLFAVGWRVSAGVGGWKVENLEKIGLYGRRSAEQSRAERQAMDQISVSITDRLAAYVRNKVKSERYNNANEVVREALRRMEDSLPGLRKCGARSRRDFLLFGQSARVWRSPTVSSTRSLTASGCSANIQTRGRLQMALPPV